jgi:GntR family transcriptional regulator
VIYIEIDTQSQVPIYAQIMDRIRALVREESLRPGSALPSVRQLAADLEINPNTVAKAYSLLEREGLVRTARRRGTLIAPSARNAALETVGSRLEEAIDRVLEAADSLGVDLAELVKALERRGQERKD